MLEFKIVTNRNTVLKLYSYKLVSCWKPTGTRKMTADIKLVLVAEAELSIRFGNSSIDRIAPNHLGSGGELLAGTSGACTSKRETLQLANFD